MAIIQYTGVVNQVRGKLNGSVFNKSRNANTLQRKQQAPRRDVGQSSATRNRFASAQRSWKELTTIQRTQWAQAAVNNPSRDRFGDLVALSGYNQYIKAHIYSTLFGVVPASTPDSSPAPDPLISISDFLDTSFTISPSGRVELDATAYVESTYSGSDMYVTLEVGLPVSQGVTTYYGRWVHVASKVLAGLTELDEQIFMSSRYPMPQLNQAVWNRIRVVYVANGAVVYEQVSFQVPIQ